MDSRSRIFQEEVFGPVLAVAKARDFEHALEMANDSQYGLTGAIYSNDAAHMHSVITGLKKVLVEMHPIADQIAVIDAGSSDGTAELARSLGVEVYSCAELLPEKGNLHGRGESWWKSLAALRGDVLVWLDPRARRFHPSTAMSLAGPLLRVPTLQLVKAYGQPRQDRKAKGRRQKAENPRGNRARTCSLLTAHCFFTIHPPPNTSSPR